MHRALKAWEALADERKAIVAHACATEANFALAEMERLNAQALAALIERHGVQLRPSRRRGRGGAQAGRPTCWASFAVRGEMAGKVHGCYVAFRERTAPWSRVSIKAVLGAREG